MSDSMQSTAKLPFVRKVPAAPFRTKDANKGSCGRVLVVGGSRGMAGAPCLAANGAMRGGAGLVKVAVPRCIWDIVATKLDEPLTAGLSDNRKGGLAEHALAQVIGYADWSDVTLLGPGLGVAETTTKVVRRAVRKISKPLVLDADGLNAFPSGTIKTLGPLQKSLSHRPLILTPHPGEMARLLQSKPHEIQKDRLGAAFECAKLTSSIVILKGEGTVVTDGERAYINKTGNAGMASGGTGDVLAGLVAALLGQGMEGFDAACLAVYLHGLAGDLASSRFGQWSLVAGDLIDELPNAFKKHAR